jgi:hypothetical protein
MAKHNARARSSTLRDEMPAWDVYVNGKRISKGRLFDSKTIGVNAIVTKLWKDPNDEIGKFFASPAGTRQPMREDIHLVQVKKKERSACEAPRLPVDAAQNAFNSMPEQDSLFDLHRDATAL